MSYHRGSRFVTTRTCDDCYGATSKPRDTRLSHIILTSSALTSTYQSSGGVVVSIKLGSPCVFIFAFVLHLHCVSGKRSCSFLPFLGPFDVFVFVISSTVVVVVNWS